VKKPYFVLRAEIKTNFAGSEFYIYALSMKAPDPSSDFFGREVLRFQLETEDLARALISSQSLPCLLLLEYEPETVGRKEYSSKLITGFSSLPSSFAWDTSSFYPEQDHFFNNLVLSFSFKTWQPSKKDKEQGAMTSLIFPHSLKHTASSSGLSCQSFYMDYILASKLISGKQSPVFGYIETNEVFFQGNTVDFLSVYKPLEMPPKSKTLFDSMFNLPLPAPQKDIPMPPPIRDGASKG